MELILRFLSIINLGVALSVPKIKPQKSTVLRGKSFHKGKQPREWRFRWSRVETGTKLQWWVPSPSIHWWVHTPQLYPPILISPTSTAPDQIPSASYCIYYSQPRQIIQCFDPISSNISPPPFLAWARARQWTFVWCSRSKNKATHWIDSSCLDRKNMDCILPELESILFKDSSWIFFLCTPVT